MTTVARPGTPFPSTESVSYFPFNASASSASSSSRRSSFHTYAQPIHFPIPSRTVLTPPSLLKRASSTGSNSSGYHLSRTPSASPSTPVLSPSMGRRESRSSSTECASPVMPTTPIVEEIEIEDEDVLAPPSTPFELPAPLYSEPEPKQSLTKGFPVKQFFTTFESITKSKSSSSGRSLSLPTSSLQLTVSRPKLKRRDTPRPKDGFPTMSPFWDQPILSPVQENGPKRRFTSMVDGKSWLVVE